MGIAAIFEIILTKIYYHRKREGPEDGACCSRLRYC